MAKKFPDKPIFNIEHGGYEASPYVVFRGNFEDPAACLYRNYYCAFAGVYSTYYWQGTSWYTVIHDPFENELDPKPKFNYYKYFSDFLNRIEFHKLTPSNNHGTSGICLTNMEKDTYVYYIPARIPPLLLKTWPRLTAWKLPGLIPLQENTVSPI